MIRRRLCKLDFLRKIGTLAADAAEKSGVSVKGEIMPRSSEVIVGRSADQILAGTHTCFRVFISSSEDNRIKRIAERSYPGSRQRSGSYPLSNNKRLTEEILTIQLVKRGKNEYSKYNRKNIRTGRILE